MGPEQGPGIEQGLESQWTVGQRVSFVEGENIMGDGKQVEKFGTIVDLGEDTAGVKVEGTGLEGVDNIVRVAKQELKAASEK